MSKDNILEMVRFSVVGVVVTGVHYGVYLLLQYTINVNIAYTLGYVVAFFINFYLTSLYTFRKKPSWKKGIGFGGAHLFNYVLHMGLVAFPGTMIGQVLGGSSPNIAIKYQMMIMVITFSASMISLVVTILLASRRSFDTYGILKKDLRPK